MSEPQLEEHTSWIQTPKQLLIVVLIAFFGTVAVILALVEIVVAPDMGDQASMSDEAVARRLEPVGTVVVADAKTPVEQKSGKEVYTTVCAACHAGGLLNAPKLGDKARWADLIARGHDALTVTAISGIRQMPPRGGNPNLTDTEVARAVAFMANQVGANWKEPEAKPKAAEKAVAQAPAAPAQPAAPAPSAPAPAAGAPGGAAADTGKAVYDKACAVCHATGVAGAPKLGDKSTWAPRIKAGIDSLYTSALKGKGAMPPKGGQTQLSDEAVKAAVDYMVNQVK